jgi:hypothetical protein
MTVKFAQYDVVRIKALSATAQAPNAFNVRPPRVGDIATIIEIYTRPPGYELECSNNEGITQWMIGIAPDEIELEHVTSGLQPG